MSPDLYAALLGLLKLGVIAVFVDPWMGWRQIAGFAGFADPRAYVGIGKSHLLRWMDGRLRRVPVTVTTGKRVWRYPAHRTLAEVERRPGDGRIHAVASTDSALITFTSGSSGVPKGANRTHGYLTAQHRALRGEFHYRDEDVDMPMFPIFALNNLAMGIPSVVPEMDFGRVDAVDPARILRQMRRHEVTTCTASPPFFDRLARHLGESSDRPRLRRILTGGAPVSDRELREWEKAFPDTEVAVVYGSTEAEPVAHVRTAERLEAVGATRSSAPGYCVGRLTDRVRARLIRIDSGPVTLDREGWPAWEVPAGEIGELVVTGDHVCKDYYRNPSAVLENKIVGPDGEVWHRMGDTGYFDDRDRFWLVGRVHSTIFREGRAVHPQLLEQSATGDDGRVQRAAAVGIPSPTLGERVVLALEASPDAALRAEVEARLEEAGQPVDEIVFLEEKLPVDPRHNSKIDYDRLRLLLHKRLRSSPLDAANSR
jgi:acyl-CoA synthetase (AMP-forming)/AMP-acid ligase II